MTLLFSAKQYQAAADAWLRGVERRIEAGLNPNVASVASLFVSRWDVAVAGKVPSVAREHARHRGRPGSLQGLFAAAWQSARWRRALNAGARPQRLLFASTGTKDPKAPDILYVKGLIAPLTVNTMPEATLHAFAAHGEVGAELSPDGGDSAEVLREFTRHGVDLEALAKRLQEEGAAAFVASWKDLLGVIAAKTAAAGQGVTHDAPGHCR